MGIRLSAIATAATLLTACATSPQGLSRLDVQDTVRSDKSARAFSACVIDVLLGANQLRGEGGHWYILRPNSWGAPGIRWDFVDQPSGGSVAELRASSVMVMGSDKVQACA